LDRCPDLGSRNWALDVVSRVFAGLFASADLSTRGCKRVLQREFVFPK
jgi:hypothetical protein